VADRLLREANLTFTIRAGRRAARFTASLYGAHGVNGPTRFSACRKYSRGVQRRDYVCLGYKLPEECRDG